LKYRESQRKRFAKVRIPVVIAKRSQDIYRWEEWRDQGQLEELNDVYMN
jgi:hypothetical protein